MRSLSTGAADVCAQHRYETHIIPLSVQYEWPRTIDFEDVVTRIKQKGIRGRVVEVYSKPWTTVNLRAGVDVPKEYDVSRLSRYFIHPATSSSG